MYKQVIVVNKGLKMSSGKLGAMVAHGSVAYFCEWFKQNINTSKSICCHEYMINYGGATIDKELYTKWIAGDFTKIVLEVENEEEMEKLVEKAKSYGFENKKDFFNIVDESTEFLDIPRWAVIAFKPMEAELIDLITGNLNLYTSPTEYVRSVENVKVGDVYKIEPNGLNKSYLIMLVVDKCNNWGTNGDKISTYKWLNLKNASLLNGSFRTKEEAEDWLHDICGCWKMTKLDVDEIHI